MELSCKFTLMGLDHSWQIRTGFIPVNGSPEKGLTLQVLSSNWFKARLSRDKEGNYKVLNGPRQFKLVSMPLRIACNFDLNNPEHLEQLHTVKVFDYQSGHIVGGQSSYQYVIEQDNITLTFSVECPRSPDSEDEWDGSEINICCPALHLPYVYYQEATTHL